MSQELTAEQLNEARVFRPIDALEYAQHNIEQDGYYRELTAQDPKLQETQSDILGSEFYFSPNESGYFVEFGRGALRGVDRDSYLDIRNHELNARNRELHTFPREVRQYYKSSKAFNRAVRLTYFPNADSARREATASFLVEHNEYANERRVALAEKIGVARQLVLTRIPALVESGVLPKSAMERLGLAETVTISITDKARGHEGGNIGGYYKGDETRIALSMYWGDDVMEEVVVHELIHLISGHRIVKNRMGIQQIERVGMQRKDIEEGKIVEGTLQANEAYTQLITNLVRNPNMDIRTALKHGTIYAEYMSGLWWGCGLNEEAVACGFEAYFTSDNGMNEGSFEKALGSIDEFFKAGYAEIQKRKRLKQLAAGVLFAGTAGLVVMRKLKR